MSIQDFRVKLNTYKEFLFLVFFLPLTGCTALGLYSEDPVYKIFFVVGLLCVALKIFITNYNKKDFILISILISLLAGILFINGEKTLVLTLLAIIGCKDLNVKRILTYTFWIYLLCFLLTFFLSFLGIIENTLIELPKNGIMYGVYDYGFGHPNSAYNHLFIIAALGTIAYSEKFSILHFFLFTILMYIGYKIFFCRTGWIVYLMLCASILLHRFFNQKKWYKFFFNLYVFMPSLIVIITFFLTWAYKHQFSFAQFINRIVTGRLHLYQNAVRNLGFHWYAPGGILTEPLDNLYLYILIRYGIIIFLIFLAIYSFTMIRLKKEHNDLAIIVLGAAAVYGFMEYSLINITWNPLFLYFAVLFRPSSAYKSQ